MTPQEKQAEERLKKKIKDLDAYGAVHRLDEKTFDDTLVDFCFEEPFYSAISRQVHKSPTTLIPTAGVTVDEQNRLLLLWNKKFFFKQKWFRRYELLKHEFLHLIFHHCTSRIPHRENKRDFAWGWATDLAINSLLDIDKLPEGGLYPGRWPELSKDEAKKFTKEQLESLKALGDLIRSMPVKESAEWYYDKLTSDPQVRKAMDMLKQDGIVIPVGLLDNHDGWEDMDPQDQEMMKVIIKGMVQKAIDECDRKQKWGSVPAEMQSTLRRLASNIVNWRALLRNFVGMARSLNHTRSMKRIDKRYPYVHPGRKRGRSSRIAVAIDESGSVSDHEIELCFAELDNLAHLTEFVVIPFDTMVREDKIFTWKRGQTVQPERVTCGGTDFSVPTDWVNKHAKEFDGFMIMTDGGCGEPIPSKLKRAYIITPGNKLYFETNELVIRMEQGSTSAYVLRTMDDPLPSRTLTHEHANSPQEAGAIASASRNAEAHQEEACCALALVG